MSRLHNEYLWYLELSWVMCGTDAEENEKCSWDRLGLRHELHGNAIWKLRTQVREGRAKCTEAN